MKAATCDALLIPLEIKSHSEPTVQKEISPLQAGTAGLATIADCLYQPGYRLSDGVMSTTWRVLVFGSMVAVTFTLFPSNCLAFVWSSS